MILKQSSRIEERPPLARTRERELNYVVTLPGRWCDAALPSELRSRSFVS